MPRHSAIRTFAVLLLVAFAAAWPLRALPRPHHGPNVRAQIVSLENDWRQAQLADDMPAMEKLLSDNYIGITITGQVVTKAQQLDRMRRRTLVVSQFEMSDAKIKVTDDGHVAIVTAVARVEGSSDEHPINGSFRYTRIYQRAPGGPWKITSFQATRISERGSGSAPPAAPPNSKP